MSQKRARSEISKLNQRLLSKSRGPSAKRIKTEVSKAIAAKSEKKYVDTQYAAVNIINSGVFMFGNGTVQGTGLSQRMGTKTFGKYAEIRYEIQQYASPAGNNSDDSLRLLVVWDRQPNFGVPAGGIFDILNGFNQASTALGTNAYLMGTNPVNKDRFIIMKDKMVRLGSMTVGPTVTSAYTAPEQNLYGKFYVNMKGKDSHYIVSGTPGLITDCATGAMYLLAIGSLAGANAVFNLYADIRYCFTD